MKKKRIISFLCVATLLATSGASAAIPVRADESAEATDEIAEADETTETTVESCTSEAPQRFTGTKEAFEGVQYDAVYQNSNLKYLKAVSDGENLYIACEAKSLGTDFAIHIETAAGKGFDLGSGGILVANESAASGETATDKTAGETLDEFKLTETGVEAKIPADMMGGYSSTYEVSILTAEGEQLPDSAAVDGPGLIVESPIMEEAPKITLDGKADDWKGLTAVGRGEGSLGDIYALRDAENLYIMTTIKDVKDPESSASYTTSLFIEADQNAGTGFHHSGYAKNNGGDFLIQDWCSYGPDQSLDIFYSEDSVDLEWNMHQQSVEGYEKVFEKTGKTGEYCAEYKIPIAVLEKITPKISDTLYVAIDRNDCQTDEETFERLTPEGFTPARNPECGSFAKVPKYGTGFKLDCSDGDLSDWENICNEAHHEDATNLCAVKDSEKLYTMVTGNGDLSTDMVYYIATDKQGFPYEGHENVSYVVRDGKLYGVEGEDAQGTWIKDVYQDYYSNHVLMQLYLEWIGNPSKIEIAVNGNDGEYMLPAAGSVSNDEKAETDETATGFLPVETTVPDAKEAGKFYPMENYEVYNNPYKGWVGWADKRESDIVDTAVDSNLVFVDIKWSELEPKKGEYDFEGIEKQYQFDVWKDRGCRMVLRFVMDNPVYVDGNPDAVRMDIPEWLFEELDEEDAEGEGAGTFYTGENILELLGGVGFSPNYKSELLLDYHKKAIEALASRYDDPSICAYVQVGSLGHWAEFHTWPEGSGEFPDPDLAQEYMQPYVDYFKNVKVGIRKPYALAADNHWGLYNDVFGTTEDGATPAFLEWTRTGNTDMPGSTEEDVEASAMPDWWQYNYSGGEFANGDFRTNALDKNVCAVLQQIRDSHTTWLGPCSGCDLKTDDEDVQDYYYNQSVMVRTMGYRYRLDSITDARDLQAGTTQDFHMDWENVGVAPIYYNCPVTLQLVDDAGAVVASGVVDADTTTWLPGHTEVDGALEIPADVAPGDYQLAVQMFTQDDRVVNLAMEGETCDGNYLLYPVTVKAADPTAETVETEATEPSEEITEDGKSIPVVPIACGAAAVVIAAGVVVLVKKRKK
ncbi:MAG: DUF4832 domain-containing protein [Lachnospiraceae bacterium]|jgi:hypothetical protein|nr:DUF4832 domain-containing protein [Lachnospiraceae bacterium]